MQTALAPQQNLVLKAQKTNIKTTNKPIPKKRKTNTQKTQKHYQKTKNNTKNTKKTIPKKQKTIPTKTKKQKNTIFWHNCMWGLELRLFPKFQENCFFCFRFFGVFGIVFLFFFGFFFCIVFLVLFQGTILWLLKYLCSPALLHKLDNIVHQDEYLAPEAIGNATPGAYGGIASGPTKGRN